MCVIRLLDRLNLFKCLLDFQAAVHKIVASVGGGGGGLHKPELPYLSFSDISGVFSSIATCLERILTFVNDSIDKRTDMGTDNDDTESSKGAGCTSHLDCNPLIADRPL